MSIPEGDEESDGGSKGNLVVCSCARGTARSSAPSSKGLRSPFLPLVSYSVLQASIPEGDEESDGGSEGNMVVRSRARGTARSSGKSAGASRRRSSAVGEPTLGPTITHRIDHWPPDCAADGTPLPNQVGPADETML